MRFAALSLLGLLGLSGVSCQCFNKVSSPNHGLAGADCVTVDVFDVELVTGAPVTLDIAQFDTTLPGLEGAVLDAVYLNLVSGSYTPTGAYNVGGTGTVTVELAVPNTWNLHSLVDNFVIKKSVFAAGLLGFATVDPSESDNGSNGCILNRGNDLNGASLQCAKDLGILENPFSLRDYRYQSTSVPVELVGTNITFAPDYTQLFTYTDFISATGTATNGVLIASSTGTGVSGYIGSGEWTLRTGAASSASGSKLDGSVILSGSAPSVNTFIKHSFKVSVEIQYDYHIPQVAGDPQFAGFQGQSFQVHGAPDAYFALISAPSYYVNARFDYISTGSCTYNETACFTHPGTYMGLIYVGMRDANILIQAGPHDTGFAGILVNDKPMTTGDRFTLSSVSADSYIQVISKSKLILNLDNIMLTVHNSDLFINFDLALMDKELLATGSVKHTIPSGSTPSQVQHHLNTWYGKFNPLHGLIGQTWRNVIYQDKKMYQGDVTEYQLDKIVDHTFLYCVYQA